MKHSRKALLASAAMLTSTLVALQPVMAAQTFKLMHFFPEQLLTSKTDQAFADEVAQKTNNEIKIEIFWAGALGKPTEVLDLVGGGAVQMGATLPNYFPAQLPFSSLGAVPLGYYADGNEALAVEREIIDNDPAARAELERAGLVPLIVHGLTPYHLICNKPVATVADLDGIKIRTFGAYAPEAIKAFGATAVNLQPAEIYEALQRGTVDCVMYNYDFAASSKLQEVAKFWSTVSFGSFSGYQVYINKDLLASLPADQQQALIDAGRAAEQAELEKIKTAEQAAIDAAKAAGVIFVEFTEQDAFDAKLPDTLEVWAQQTVANGVPQADVDRVVALIRAKVGK